MVLKVRVTARKKEAATTETISRRGPLLSPLFISQPRHALSPLLSPATAPSTIYNNRSSSPWNRTTASSSSSARRSSSRSPTRRSRPCRPASASSAASSRGSRRAGRRSAPTRTRARRGALSCSSRRSGRARRRRARVVRPAALRQERRLSPRRDIERQGEKKRNEKKLVIQERARIVPPPFIRLEWCAILSIIYTTAVMKI